MSRTPRVSVILPVFNGEKHLASALESVLGQTFGDFELLVVDDGSSDGTREIVERYASADRRVAAFHRERSGRAAIPRNFGLDRVQGDFVTFIDHDDWFERDRIERLVEGLDANPHWIAAVHDVKITDEQGGEWIGTWFHNRQNFNESVRVFRACGGGWHESGPAYFPLMCRGNMGFTMDSVMIARRRLEFSRIRFDTSFQIYEDFDLWMRLVLMGSFGYLDRVLAYYRQRAGSTSQNLRAKSEDELLLHRSNFERARGVVPEAELARYRRYIAGLHARFAWELEVGGEAAAARTHYRAAIGWEPGLPAWWRLVKSYPPLSLLRSVRAS